jgi:hypothetical protein
MGIARRDHGLRKVLPGPAMPDPSTPCGQTILKRPYGRFRSGRLTGWVACGRLLPLWTPHAIHLCSLHTTRMDGRRSRRRSESANHRPHHRRRAYCRFLSNRYKNADLFLFPLFVTASFFRSFYLTLNLTIQCITVKNFPCQTLKISKASIVVKGL